MNEHEKLVIRGFLVWVQQQKDLLLLGEDDDGFKIELGASDLDGLVADYAASLEQVHGGSQAAPAETQP